MADDLEAQVMATKWFYRFVLPSGRVTVGYGPEKLHVDRLTMMWAAIEKYCGNDLRSLTAIDLACHQGWFSHHLASGGFARVVGVDARLEHLAQAEVIRGLYGAANLRFAHHKIHDPAVGAIGKWV